LSEPLDWVIDGAHWPHRDRSAFVETAGLDWHVQRMGNGPTLLLLHGTGASSHSWRGVMPLLAKKFDVVAPDLPGHAFTRGRPRGGLTLPAMADSVGLLIDKLGVRPAGIIGHSAGMAIALQSAISRGDSIPLIGLNAAIKPFAGLAARMFPALAKLLVLNPLVPRLFAARARMPGETERFLRRATNSRIDGEGIRCYEILFGSSSHCAGALEMMAGWDLSQLETALGAVVNPVLFVHSSNDPAVGMAAIEDSHRRIPGARLEVVDGLGHLAHEESPGAITTLIDRFIGDAL
jgi:magnesium chelatase accessory protein